ncbi:MAG: hypothetical protein N4J56_002890 [Chroococcidiopsis sp. SAG 2025]|uniref:hypothetical protein n=1 Tax=Chroococcidiopsis sp. SAG 2025 TaxID=171389 RepID=UPI0029370CA2|nr:hypothetical protein [Chroococcidiopsis sp. SAG 2025]MDV2993236.1 hypothetical protein [Chroococcidiopsis sp. SAG 2025]
MQKFKNAIALENLEYTKQQGLLDALSKSLQQQNTLLEVRKSLSQSLANYYEGELGIIQKLTTNEQEKQQLAEAIAGIKIKALLRQQELERDILEMNIQQKEIALELEKSKNNQAQLQNQADIAQAQADIKKTEARQDLTPEQKETQLAADYANLQVKILAGANLYYQGQLLDSQGAINQYQADVERSNQARQQDLAYDSARADYVEAMADPTRKQRAARALKEEILIDQVGDYREGANITNLRNFNQENQAGLFRDRNGNFLFQPPYRSSGYSFDSYTPAPNLPASPDYQKAVQEYLKNPLRFVQPVYNPPANLAPANTPFGRTGLLRPVSEDMPSKAIQLTGDLKMENTVHVHLESKEDKALGQQLENTILNSLDGVFKVVERNLR